MSAWRALLFALLLAATAAIAHEVRPAYLEIRQTSPDAYAVLWKVPARGEGLRLAIRPLLPEGTVAEGAGAAVMAGDAIVERWSIRRAGGLGGGTIRIAGLDATLTDVLVRFQRLDGGVQVVRLTPSSPSFVVEAAPSAFGIASSYAGLGIEHILLGFDHLLFVLALMLIVRGGWRLAQAITAFTVAHSITLGLAVLGILDVPQPPVEAAIALSILLLAAEVVRQDTTGATLASRAPWLVAFAFGLLHGLGFASALLEIGLPTGDIPLALMAFNVGVELGQLAFVIVFVAAARALSRWSVASIGGYARPATAYAVGSLAAFWLVQRVAAF
jgi:hydrogenase/urease accessory protein HupE